MCKKDLYNRVLNAVVLETEISEGDLRNMSNKTLEVVDARHLLVYFLRRSAGYNIGYISSLLEMTNQGVNKIMRHFDDRRRQGGNGFETTFQRIRNILETN